jgi:hypothetical protein
MSWIAQLGLSSAQAITAGIAVLALIVSVIAIVVGELRALHSRRVWRERREVVWKLSWPSPATVRIENAGEDEARRVLIVMSSEALGVIRVESRRVSAHSYFDVQSDHLKEAWGSIEKHYEHLGGMQQSGGVYRESFYLRAYWRSPLKTPDSTAYDTNITRQIDLDAQHQSLLAARARAGTEGG